MLKKKCIVEATKKPHMPQAWKTPPPILAWLQLSCVLPEPEVNFWVPTLTSWAGLPGYVWLNPLVFTHYSKDGGFSIWNGVLWIFQNNTVVWIYTHTHTHTPNRLKVPSPPPEKKYLISFCQKKVRSFALHGKKRYQYHSDINCLGTNFLWVYPVINYFLELHFLELHSNVGVDIPFNPRIMDGKTG